NLLLVIVKPLTFVLALATAIHVAQSYVEGLREGKDRVAAAARAFREKLVPCFWSSATVVLGLVALATADVPPIRRFGLIAGAGMAVAFLLVFFLLVPALAIVGPTRPREEGPDRFGHLAERTVRASTASPVRAALVALGALAFTIAGGFALERLD